MVIGRILAPVHSLGPGERICIWTKGCRKRCPGCIAPELWERGAQDRDIPAEKLAQVVRQLAKKGNCHALTISGGDPFEQAEGLLAFLKLVREDFEDILVYTGYTRGEIEGGECKIREYAAGEGRDDERKSGAAGQAGTECLEWIDVLIDGRYEEDKNTPDCVLRGSANQVIHFLNENLRGTYEEYMKAGRVLENFLHGEDTIVTGIMNRGL